MAMILREGRDDNTEMVQCEEIKKGEEKRTMEIGREREEKKKNN